MGKLTTINDVAKEAGVSKSTVSRVLNNSSKISENTKKKVIKIAQKLKYEPNHIARSLTKKKTFTIGVVLEDILNPFFSEVAKGIETALKRCGYSMLLTSSDFDYDNEIRLTRMLVRYKVDGVLITPVRSDSEGISLLKEKGIPFIMMNCSSGDKDINWIESNNLEGGYIATRYLLGLGHTRFMCIRHMAVEGSEKRFEGFKKAMKEAGLKLSDQILLGDVRSRLEGYEIVNKFIKDHGRKHFPSAVVAVNDAVAIGVMESLLEHEVRIPEDISIIGYDDINIAGLVRVPLTTIHQPKFRMGEIAASQLIDKIERNEAGIARQFLIEPKLIVRKSCGKCGDEK